MEVLKHQPQQEDEQQLLWKSKSAPESMVTVTLGRVMATLLSARPKKLHDAISRLSPSLKTTSLDSLDESLWFLHKYVRDAADRGEKLDDVLVPLIEHSLRSKESKRGGQDMIILNWFFKDEHLFDVLAKDLASFIKRRDDHYLILGWCTLVRTLLECESAKDQYIVDEIKEKYEALLKILCSCIPCLSSIVNERSIMQDGFELPSRLSISAADCLLSITEALTKKSRVANEVLKSSKSTATDRSISLTMTNTGQKKLIPVCGSSQFATMEKEILLWNHLEELISLVQRLLAWSRKSRPLHAKGLEKVLKWLQEIKEHYGEGIPTEAGSKNIKAGALLLSSCWKHYSMLLHLEDRKFSKCCKELLEQFLSGIQFYTDQEAEGRIESKDGGRETRKFFLNCIYLLLGRFDGKKFEIIMSEYASQMTHILLSQLHCDDEDVIDGVVCVLKAALLKPYSSPANSLTDSRKMESLLPLLLHFLDEQDNAAKAIVMLIAEYCSKCADDHCLKEVLKRLTSENVIQRRNAVDVISELIRISSHSDNVLSHLAWQDIASHLLECLGDKETVIREKTSNLLPMIDPLSVLPTLVHLVCSSDGRVQSSATSAFLGVLKFHNQKFEVISMLLDCLSNLTQSSDIPQTAVQGAKLDSDRVLRLTPQWSSNVQDWNALVGPLIDKMFAEPSNAVIVRFLSYISEHLADVADAVLHCILLHISGQEEIDESFSKWERETSTSEESVKIQKSLFGRLCPLLILRLLPVRVFDNLNSSIMYGQFVKAETIHESGDINIFDRECVAAFLLRRALARIEFEDVRKLAAELCGRIHPQVLIPVACTQLKHAADSQNVLKIKACLFSLCTSIMVRGKDSILHPAMLDIRKTLEAILLWPSVNEDEVAKAQHGCIDCLALMVCAELQSSEVFKTYTSVKSNTMQKNSDSGNYVSRNSVLVYVLYHITRDKNKVLSSSKLSCKNCTSETLMPLSFRLCMANVLISACQKISESGKKRFVKSVLPVLINFAEVVDNPEIGTACIQVLFSAVYHLKSAVLPYSSNLLELSLNFLKEGSEQEKMAGAKLIASLMASEDAILESISGTLPEARFLLSSISSSDPSINLRQVCEKLLACMTS